ncbi:MAG: hypothetical protein R3E77_09305 [Steroidobacteraceae bacterium]
MTRLGPIRAVTVAVAQLQPTIDVYQLHLGYQLMERGRIDAGLAALWACPSLAGRRYALMLPGGDSGPCLRFVEGPSANSFRPFGHFGWNAAEIMVQDVDALAEKLADGPFRVIGPPADLSFSDKIRAMQVLGPSNEALYLTMFKERLAEFDTPDARHPVDRVFIVIVGGPSVTQLSEFYARHLGTTPAAPMQGVISVLSAAHDLPRDTAHELAALSLAGQSFIELDTMPSSTTARPQPPGELPVAISMVSFAVDALPDGLSYRATPRDIAETPYHGRRAAVCVGAGGEWIELIES